MDLHGSPYQGYLYAYPHKTAYRPLRPRPPLTDVWAGEQTGALFLYLHVPFCEMRCGFCNLFTRARPPAEQVRAYLAQLRRQAGRVGAALGPAARFARGAIGGGTPTYLTAAELHALFDVVDGMAGRPLPVSVETSPATATADRIAVLVERGASRISIGVQSFLDVEAHAAGRPQRRVDVDRALAVLRDLRAPAVNIDLIYGIPGQTPRSWEVSLAAALSWAPEELYLYPLYVRPLTGLARRPSTVDDEWDGQRLSLYRQARDRLRAAGYRQLSMRHFRRPSPSDVDDGDYCCQDDGMVGLGCGARSYTRNLHYSFDYAVGIRGVRGIIDDYLKRPVEDFEFAEVGFWLDGTEQRRRWLVKTLLRTEGTDVAGYAERFGTALLDDFPQLATLGDEGWLSIVEGRLVLTDAGLERSDAVGPWLVSGPVRTAMAEYVPR